MTVDRTDNNLSRFQFSAPAWWAGFNAGRQTAREQAQKELADWRASDWQRDAAGKISEGAEA
jgi:hypothetical protein